MFIVQAIEENQFYIIVTERHHAWRFDAGGDDDDGATTGSGLARRCVDFENQISGFEVRNLVFGNRSRSRGRSRSRDFVKPRRPDSNVMKTFLSLARA